MSEEMMRINRDLQRLTEYLDENKQQAENLAEVMEMTQQINTENAAILDELAYYWKGGQASRCLYQVHEDQTSEYRQVMRNLEEQQDALYQERRMLFQKEDALFAEQVNYRMEDDHWD